MATGNKVEFTRNGHILIGTIVRVTPCNSTAIVRLDGPTAERVAVDTTALRAV